MNLKEKFGSKYRVTMDESYQAEKELGKTNEQWRYFEIKGKHGTLYPYKEHQAALTFNSIIVANRFKNKPWKVIQDGDEERTVLVPSDALDEVLEAIQPRKRWYLSPERKQKAMANLIPIKKNLGPEHPKQA